MKTLDQLIQSIYTFCYQQEKVSKSEKWLAVMLLLLTVIVPVVAIRTFI